MTGVAVGLALAELATAPARGSVGALSPGTATWTVATLAPLAWARSRPVASPVVTAAALAGGTLLLPSAELLVVGLVAFLVGPFVTASRAPSWRSAVGGGVLVAALLALQGVWDDQYGSVGAAAANTAFALLGWAAGATLRVVDDRSARRLAGARREAADALRDERAAMARDLHDVVSNALAVVAVQAGGALAVVDRDPAAARAALEEVQGVARRALVDMRRLLDVLRAEPGAEEPAGPGLDALTELAEPLRRAGISVSVESHGSPARLSPGTETTAVRVVQEALSNVVRHSGARTAGLTIRWSTDALELDVVDDGPGGGAAPGPGHHGLVGMRERVDLLGGELQAGPRQGGGWAVQARLPVGGSV
ncbi:sensor histidine kinase [uncultured Pseudokineococcus sp.]|uniref:sensor histidine kinase n=1 Tax=uncultured Pseudokineococcus sp. TaxID=1642928 RepID=UPI002606A8EE|nr:histidine kinase [uncultured Pseudokineococcus sp.]